MQCFISLFIFSSHPSSSAAWYQPGAKEPHHEVLYKGVGRSLHKAPDSKPCVSSRSRGLSSQFLRPQISRITSIAADNVPLVHLKHKVGTSWEYSSNLTDISGTTFQDKDPLLTGVGKGSIGVEIMKGLLSGRAHVIRTMAGI